MKICRNLTFLSRLRQISRLKVVVIRTCLLPYERNNSSKTINIPLYMLFVLDKELKAES
mgnify:FL=1